MTGFAGRVPRFQPNIETSFGQRIATNYVFGSLFAGTPPLQYRLYTYYLYGQGNTEKGSATNLRSIILPKGEV